MCVCFCFELFCILVCHFHVKRSHYMITHYSTQTSLVSSEATAKLSMDSDNKLFGPFVDHSVEFYRWQLLWYILSLFTQGSIVLYNPCCLLYQLSAVFNITNRTMKIIKVRNSWQRNVLRTVCIYELLLRLRSGSECYLNKMKFLWEIPLTCEQSDETRHAEDYVEIQ